MFRMTNNAASGPRLRAFFAHLMLPLLIWSSQPQLGCACGSAGFSASQNCKCGKCGGRCGRSCCRRGLSNDAGAKCSLSSNCRQSCDCQVVAAKDIVPPSVLIATSAAMPEWVAAVVELPKKPSSAYQVASRATLLCPASPHDLLASLQRFTI